MSQTTSQETAELIAKWEKESNMDEWRKKHDTPEERKKRRERREEKDKETCEELKHLFHMSMELGFLPSLKKREKMMEYLNTKGNPFWTDAYIWCLADSNKIDWVKGYGDPTPYDTYKAQMNRALANILRPE